MVGIDEVVRAAKRRAALLERDGARGNWDEAETTVAMAILVWADASRLGGTKVTKAGVKRQHPAVIAAATAIGRSEDAVVLKVMNLRSVLSGGARGMRAGSKVDRWAVARYANRLDHLLTALFAVADHLSGVRVVYRLLRGPGIPPEVLAEEDVWIDTERPTERRTEVVARRGQGVFRGRVLPNYAYACAFCGLKSRKPDRNTFLLIASHILPWRAATDHQRLDPANGLSLCAIHDRAFEWGFLTVDDGLRVRVSDGVTEHYEPDVRVEQEILALDGRELTRADRGFVPPGQDYLEHHRSRVFDRRFRAA